LKKQTEGKKKKNHAILIKLAQINGPITCQNKNIKKGRLSKPYIHAGTCTVFGPFIPKRSKAL